MARVRDFLAEFMLEHISIILEKYPISVGDYVLGQRVKCVESHGDYSFVTVGVICGFEYFNSPDFDGVGYFYQVTVTTCNTNHSNLQSTHFQTRIICNYNYASARINCN